MQQTLIVTGDPVVSTDIQTILKSLVSPAVLQGMQLFPSASDTVGIEPGVALTDSGVLIVEDEIKNIQFTLGVSPTNWTILYQYAISTSFGGNPATLVLQSGLVDPSTFTNGVVLGWIVYPGGSVPLSTSMFIEGPRVQVSPSASLEKTAFEKAFAPFSSKWTLVSVTGATPGISEIYDTGVKAPVTNVTNGGGVSSKPTYYYPFRVPAEGIGQISIEMSVPVGAIIYVTIVDKDGNIMVPTNMTFVTNQAAMQEYVFKLPAPSAAFTTNTEAFVKLAMEIQPTYTLSVKSIGVSSYKEPF